MKQITILGGGGTGCTLAADLSRKGHSVTLFDFPEYFSENLTDVRSAGSITMKGLAGTGTFPVACVTDNLSYAIENAELIFVAMLASRHERLVYALAPLLREGQTVCFSAGNCGSILLRRALGAQHRAIVGEMSGNIYPCRIAGPATVNCAMGYKPKRVAACPGQDTPRLLAALEGVYECFPAQNPIQTTLNSPNINNHVAAALLNVANIDRNQGFRLYRDGFSEHVVELIDQLEQEKETVMNALGYSCVSFAQSRRNILDFDQHPELDPFRDIIGPDSLQHRYITEDASTGLCLLYSLARMLELETPILDALLSLASALNHTDYRKGRNLAALGLAGLNRDQLNQWLQKGTLKNEEDSI